MDSRRSIGSATSLSSSSRKHRASLISQRYRMPQATARRILSFGDQISSDKASAGHQLEKIAHL
jgi:hypothetical protein